VPKDRCCSAHADRKTRLTIATWPRLLSLALTAQYLSIGQRTLESWIAEGFITPIRLPGSTLKSKHGQIICRANDRRLHKILLDREDLDQLIDQGKEAYCTSPSRTVTCGHCGATAGTCGHDTKSGCGLLEKRQL